MLYSTLAVLVLSSCTAGDPLLKIFAEVDENNFAGSDTCSTTCVVNLFPNSDKTQPVIQSGGTTPQSCDPGFLLVNQSWQVANIDLSNPTLCAQFGTNNPTEVLCEVSDGNTVASTYLGLGEFPFVPQGCDRAGLDLTIIVENLLNLPQSALADFSCETLTQAYDDNLCIPSDNTNPVCAALNNLVVSGQTSCSLGS